MRSAALLRQQADLAAELHRRTRSLGRTLDALIEVQPALASALLPAQVLLREVEGRLCDVSDHIHTIARRGAQETA